MLTRVFSSGAAANNFDGPTPAFQIIQTPFGNTGATSISADGSVVLGEYFLPQSDPRCQTSGGCTRVFRWTAANGPQDVPPIDNGTGYVEGHAINANGSQIVGESVSELAFRRAFIWTAPTGTKDIGTPITPNGPHFNTARAWAISATGAVIAGEAVPPQTSSQPDLIPRAFRFRTDGGFEILAPLPNELQSRAFGVSADGAVIVGISYDRDTFVGRAFRWQGGVPQDLGELGGGGDTWATAASSDGSVVVGTSSVDNCSLGCERAFRWTAAGGMQNLGHLGAGSYGLGISADGSVIVGTAPAEKGFSRAIRWTAQTGLQDLNPLVDTGGWHLIFANAVSADGTVIVGQATNLSTGADAAYRLVLPPPVCAPITCASIGKNCGTISDGCGNTLTCGSCTEPQSCGGGGVANVCGPCQPTTCEAQGKNCGAIPDGCGAWLACGSCTSPEICGGAGTPGVCEAPPPNVNELTFDPNPVPGGSSTTGTVTLSGPAPPPGATVRLSSTSAASVPATVEIPAGSSSANFTVTTSVPPSDIVASISACYPGVSANNCVTRTLFITAPPAGPQPSVTASRKQHGTAGEFTIFFPFSGETVTECRSGGPTNDYQFLVFFGSSVTVNGNPQAQVTSGTGIVGSGGTANGGMVTVNQNVVTVPLTNVTSGQRLQVTLYGVSNGSVSGNVVVPMNVLVGDATGNGSVTASDIGQVKQQSGQAVTSSNFRADVTANGGSINASDIGLVKSASGTQLPR
jgi:probable HAF family extracellular repeat protein